MEVHAEYTGDIFGKQASNNPRGSGLNKHYTMKQGKSRLALV
jgi:hypothetical protein